MKKYFIILLWTMIIALWWCTKKIEKSVIFEDYKIVLQTKYNYQEIIANISSETSTLKQYIQDTQTWFASSIIIAKDQITNQINLNLFAENNSKSITTKIIWSKKPKTNMFSFNCKKDKIDWVIQKIIIKKGEETQYLNQLFFIIDKNLYWISTMTLDKKEHNNLNKSLKRISCL